MSGERLSALTGFFVPLAEPLDAAGGVDDAGFTREIGVTAAANVQVDRLFRRSSIPGVTASADDRRFDVLRVDIGLHDVASA
jgi:hypothetical protein